MRARSVFHIALGCWAGTAHAQAAGTRIAVFPCELEDFTAAADHGTSPPEGMYLAQSTAEATRQLRQSGRYNVVTTEAADMSPAQGHGLHYCNGCQSGIAAHLGAEQALLCIITKISMTEYGVRLVVSDARSGKVVSDIGSGLRIGADYAWSRGVRSLMRDRMVTPK